MATSKRGGSSEVPTLELVGRSVPPNANCALAKADAMIIAAHDFIEPVTIKGAVSFAIRAL